VSQSSLASRRLAERQICFVVFCGVLKNSFAVFCGCFVVFCECFSKNSVLRCFAVFWGCFAMFWTYFANVFCRHFLSVSERKTHSTVLRCIAQSVFCVRFVRFVYFFWSVLVCFVKNAKNTDTKHRKTPQNTAKHRKTLFLLFEKP